MERINFGYSVKNIPSASEREYKLKLIEKIEAVIKRMRWKAIFFNEQNYDAPKKAKPTALRLQIVQNR